MIEYTIAWYQGEVFEAKFILAGGILIGVLAFLLYLLGSTPASRALLIPLLVLASLLSGIGGMGWYRNSQKLIELTQTPVEDIEVFGREERERVDGFMYLYPMSVGISLGSFLVALALLYWSRNIHLQAVAIGLILLGMSFAVIDYFSKERALIYQEQLYRFLPK